MKTFFLLLLVIEISAWAGQSANSVLSSYWIPFTNDTVLNQLSEQFEITRKLNGGYEILVPLSKSREFLNQIPEAQLLELDTSLGLGKNWRGGLTGYHDFESVQAHLKSVHAKYPQLTSLEQYGTSLEKRPLMAIRVTSPETERLKPAILLTASTHGDEPITVEVLLGLLDKLVSGYPKDTRLAQLLNSYEVYMIPVINPDGYVRTERYANGVDPNRDYPWIQEPDHKSNPCVEAVMKFYESHKIKASIDFHAFGEMIIYPWAYTYDSLPSFEENVFDSVTTQMANYNGYKHGQISKVIYVAKGSSADYYHWKHHAWALGIEVGTSKAPPANQISQITDENTESTWTFIESIK